MMMMMLRMASSWLQKVHQVPKSIMEYQKVLQSTKKYYKVPKSTKKYQIVPKSPKKDQKVPQSTKSYDKVCTTQYKEVPAHLVDWAHEVSWGNFGLVTNKKASTNRERWTGYKGGRKKLSMNSKVPKTHECRSRTKVWVKQPRKFLQESARAEL